LIAVLAALVLIQSLATALPSHRFDVAMQAMAAGQSDAMPCADEHDDEQGSMPCCNDSPTLPMGCAGDDCGCADGALVVSGFPALTAHTTDAPMASATLPADRDAWPASEHDAPPLRPPIST